MVFQVVGANSRRTKIEIALPITATGEPVLDDEDEPIEGRDPAIIVLPRFGFIPREQLKELTKASAQVDKRKLTDDYTAFDRAKDSILAQIGPLVDAEVRPLLEELMLGELQQISDEWSRSSTMSLPESSASNGSSRTTRGPSTTTSSVTATA